MIRIKRGNVSKKKRKKILHLAKGYRNRNSNIPISAYEQVIQSRYFSYVGRKLKKRNFRQLWVMRLNAVAMFYGYCFSQFIGNLRKKNIFLNKKMLCTLMSIDVPIIKLFLKLCF